MSFLSKWFKKKAPVQIEATIGTATVTTPPEPLSPKGYYWDRLAACTTKDELLQLYVELNRHGYGEDGQIMKAVKEKLT